MSKLEYVVHVRFPRHFMNISLEAGSKEEAENIVKQYLTRETEEMPQEVRAV